MDGAQIHFEVFVRRRPGGDWTLEMATEDRAAALTAAEAVIAERKALEARVTKETLDPETRGFRSAFWKEGDLDYAAVSDVDGSAFEKFVALARATRE